MKSFGLRFLFYRTDFPADDLRRMTSVYYRIGYCYELQGFSLELSIIKLP